MRILIREMRIGCLILRELWRDLASWFCLFVCFYIYFAGVGTREILTMDYKYNSAEQGKTTSGLQDLLEREISTHDLASHSQRVSMGLSVSREKSKNVNR